MKDLTNDLIQMASGLNNPVFGVDAAGLIEFWNEATERATGVSSQEAIGQPALHFATDESKSTAQPFILAVLSGEDPEDFELEFPDSAGETATLLLRCSARRNSAGDVVGAIAVGLDISKRVQGERETETRNRSLEDQLARRTEELREAESDMKSFSSSVSHDLRGPLRSISGFSLAVLDRYGDQLDDQGRAYLERVRNATHRMGSLIDDLTALSQVMQAELMLEPLDLGTMAKEQAAKLMAEDPERQCEFAIPEHVAAFGDEHLIAVLVDNLVGNAWKFSSKHSSARIEVGMEEQSGETVYFVKDDGAGFDMQYVDKLFLPFQRLHPADEFAGTGIGLATVKRIVQRHGGRIWAKGEVDKGAAVYFTLGAGAGQAHE